MRFVVVTNLWPGPDRPAWGTFVADRVDSLRRLGHEVEVFAVGDHSSALVRYAGLTAAIGRRRRTRADRENPISVVEAHIAYPTGLLAERLARRLRAPLVLFAHGSDVLRAPQRSRVDAQLSRRLFGRAAMVISNTDFLAEQVTERLGVPAERVAVCPPGIRYPLFATAASRRGSGERSELLFVGHLIHRKAVDVLLTALEAMATPPPLTVVGDGPERAGLELQAREAGLDVTFVGAQPPDRVAEAMADARILAVPSREEALGLVALEGMAAGCLPVASAVGGLAEIVVEDRTGFSCPAEQPAALAEAIERARRAAVNPVRSAELRAAGDRLARSHDLDEATARTVDVLGSVVSGR